MRNFRVKASRLPKEMAYPIQRCELEAAFDIAEVKSVREVSFRNWPGRALLEALFQGQGRRNKSAGTCSLEINAIPARKANSIEPLVVVEAIPAFLIWLRTAEQSSVEHPKDIFHWRANIENGKLVISN